MEVTMAKDHEFLGVFLLFMFWLAALVLIDKMVGLADPSLTHWHWILWQNKNMLAAIGKLCLPVIVSFFPALFFVDKVIGIPIRRRRRAV
jgi:hypothetical protein